MRWLLFLSRLAFICGIFFLLSLSLLIWDWINDESLISTIITIGYFMGLIIVPVTLLCYLVLWLFRKKPATIVPRWLIMANIFVLLILAGYIVYNNYVHTN
jgi:heme/copper-type cytochrome/quinol oxidase subunit 2